MNYQPTIEKSEEQATYIRIIGSVVPQLDLEYCRSLANDFRDRAIRQESLAVLNPMHLPSKNTLLRLQGEALSLLCDYVDKLKQIDEMKSQISYEEQTQDKIKSLFV